MHPDESCTLSPPALNDRLAAWRGLTAHGRHRAGGPGRVHSTYPADPGLVRHLTRLIDAEGDCCAFLAFDVHATDTEVHVELRYPPELAAAVTDGMGLPARP